ncbi:MAG: GyrI-like domain-containing protein [Halobacteriota archaeon]|jgi:effector-binding domain-containing protein
MAKIEEKMADEMRAACIFHKGAVAAVADDMGQILSEVIEWVMKRGLQMAGPPFAVYYSSQEDMARGEMQFDVGIPFIGDAQGEGKIQIKTFPAQEVLSAIHKGPYNQIAPVYAALMEYAAQNDYKVTGAPMELYLTNPMEVAESDVLTEVRFPIAKRGR